MTQDNLLSIAELKKLSPQIAEKIPYLKILVLFGSRTKGNIHRKSDWDFAVVYDEEIRKNYIENNAFVWFEVPEKLGNIFQINSDIIDLVELDGCSPLLGFHVARDGKLIYEKNSGGFVDFQMKAWKIYADTAKFRKYQRKSIELWLENKGV